MAIANFAMYDLPEVAAATDALWAGMARALTREGLDGVPGALTRGVDLDRLWRGPELLFSQTCGYPLTHAYKDALRLVATPVYDAAGCQGPDYVSLIVVREADPVRGLADLRGRTAAVNHATSQSGYSALRASVAELAHQGRFFGRVVESGSHGASLALVAAGEADVCATDCVTHALLARHRPEALRDLRVLARSPAAPGLPYVTRAAAGDELVARLRAALFAALEDPDLATARAALLLAGAEVLPISAYQPILEMEARAEALGYAEVA
jgi:ABC-type phosphate/phosphonate transport system substrate-binding protein